MKIYYAPYSLQPKHSLNSLAQRTQREGALLKVEDGGFAGYADLHPLIEFGDLSLADHLKSLKSASPSLLAERSLHLAYKDLQARKSKMSLIRNQKLKNNFMIADILSFDFDQLQKLEDFKTLKIKVGRDWKKEAEALNELKAYPFRVRLDANSSFTANSFHDFLYLLEDAFLEKIEYIEDPTPYELNSWREFQKQVPVAIDFELEKASKTLMDAGFSVVILKSSRQNVEDLVDKSIAANLKITFTSSMDHLVGIAHGVAIAESYKNKYPENVLDSGFLTYELFEEDEFSREVSIKDTSLHFPSGFGIGFSKELEACHWKEL